VSIGGNPNGKPQALELTARMENESKPTSSGVAAAGEVGCQLPERHSER
jgi:hypothetical protein